MGILSGINKKKQIEPVILSVKLLISEILKQNLKEKSDNSISLEIEDLKFENFQITFLQKKGGYILRYFEGFVRAPLLLYIPDDFIVKYISLKNRKVPESELVNIFDRIPEYLFAEIKPDTDSVKGSVEKSNFIYCTGSFLSNKDEFLWNASAYKISQISLGSVSCFLLLEENRFIMFNNKCQENNISFNLLKDFVEDNIVLAEFDNNLKLAENKEDFLFGRFLLPRNTLLGEHVAVSGFDSVIFNPEFKIKEDGVNFVLNLTIDGNIYRINYFIPSKIESRDNISRMIKTIVKAVLPMWKKYFEIQKIGVSGSFPEAVEVESLFSGDIKYKNSLIPLEVGLSSGIIDLFSTRLLESDLNISANSTRVILLNQSLLHIFLKEDLFLPLSLSKFLNLIDKIDLRKIVQNFFSGTGWKGSDIQGLFSFSKKDFKKNKIYYFNDPLFDRESFFKYLPKLQKEEWKQSRSASDSYDDMVSSGLNTLHDIYHAFRNDHLELSYKASLLLINEFKVKGDKKIREELDKVIEKESFSYLLEDTFPRDVQNLLAKLSSKVFANAVVLFTESLVNLEPFMSRNYKSEVKDLIKIIQRNSIKDGFDMEEIRIDFFELHNGLKGLSKEELI